LFFSQGFEGGGFLSELGVLEAVLVIFFRLFFSSFEALLGGAVQERRTNT
jgi:hypothetical protein